MNSAETAAHLKTLFKYDPAPGALRFVMVDGKRILQQCWRSPERDPVWLDVPMDETL